MSKVNINCDDVMFLFGVGISIPVGIPAMRGIYSAYMDKKKSGISSSDKKTCEFFINDIKILENPDNNRERIFQFPRYHGRYMSPGYS